MSDFFAKVDPYLYDLSLPYVVPGVRQAQALRSSFFRDSFDTTMPLFGLDVGVGTGSDLKNLMADYDDFSVFGIDQSSNLTKGLIDPDKDNHTSKRQVHYIEGDFTQWDAFAKVQSLCHIGLDFVSSSFAIHNVPEDLQQRCFEYIARMLKPKAPFFYLDLVGYDCETLQSHADNADLLFIEQQMRETPNGASEREWQRLAERWNQHYQTENFITPLNSFRGPSVTEMFAAAGLSQPEVIYRHYNTTLLYATRLELP